MDFFSNLVKNTVNKAETLGNAAKAAVTSTLSPTGSSSDDIQRKSSEDQATAVTASPVDTTNEYDTTNQAANLDANLDEQDPNAINYQDETYGDGTTETGATTSFNTAKAKETAKYFGSFLVNVANKAGQTVSATAKQLKNTVESVGIMQDFTKEQQDFIKEHGGKMDLSEPPWVGCNDEEIVKQEILSLSQDKRNFVRSPPASVEFQFDMNSSYPIALALLKEDPELAKMRYEIVPKFVNEETFWKNYFYRVSLIKQDPNFTSDTDGNSKKGWGSKSSSSSEGPDDPNEEQTVGESEFVSDAFQNTSIDVTDVRQDMYKLGIHTNEEIDEELEKDLQEFDFVSGNTGKIDEEEINRELENFDIK